MIIQRAGGRAEFRLLVAIETDPERSRRRPALLSQGDAEQMLAHLAADLQSLISGIRKCRLAAAGVLFDQCQLLRPGTPVYAALSGAVDSAKAGGTTPDLAAIGAVGGKMPQTELQPDENIPPAVLGLLPMLAEGPATLLEELAEAMEHRFLAEGQVSAQTASWLETAFGIGLGHARFMTLTDLNAMFRMQLEHFGYLPLWELIDVAMAGGDGDLSLETGNGTQYAWRDGKVLVTFQTFDWWANEGAGKSDPAEPESLTRGYGEWIRELRRYTSTLAAHGVPVGFALPAGCDGEVSRNFLYEEVAAPAVGPIASITEHSRPELGILAVTAALKEGLRHYYPLTPRGLNEIHDSVTSLELAGEGMAFPGQIETDRSARRLRPATFEMELE